MHYVVYILYSQKLQQFYIGTTDNISKRLEQHNTGTFGPKAHTFKGIPWVKFLIIEDLNSDQAYKIEAHIKRMKSKTYIKNLKQYSELIQKLKDRYK